MFLESRARPVCSANITAIFKVIRRTLIKHAQQDAEPQNENYRHCLGNVGSLTSHNPIRLQGLIRGLFCFFLLYILPCRFPVLTPPGTPSVAEDTGHDDRRFLVPPLLCLFDKRSVIIRNQWKEIIGNNK
jgi:hypothetical protein